MNIGVSGGIFVYMSVLKVNFPWKVAFENPTSLKKLSFNPYIKVTGWLCVSLYHWTTLAFWKLKWCYAKWFRKLGNFIIDLTYFKLKKSKILSDINCISLSYTVFQKRMKFVSAMSRHRNKVSNFISMNSRTSKLFLVEEGRVDLNRE